MNADNSRDSSRETGPRRVIGRPFLPGQSGNPGGRKKGLMPLVRKATSDGKLLVDFLVRVVAGKVSKATVADRIRAAAELMDRGYGKPRPTTDEAMQGAYGVLLSSRFVWEILTHQEMAPRWISTKNIHAKDKPAQLCAHLPPPPPHSQQHFQVTS